MNKILGVVPVAVAGLALYVSPLSGYQLTNEDYDIVERVTEQTITLIENSEKYSAEKVVIAYDNFLETRETSERYQLIVETVIDDVKYEYYVGEYAVGSISAEDCYDDEVFDTNTQTCLFKENAEVKASEADYVDQEEPLQKNEDFSEEEEILASYEVQGDEILLLDGSHTADYKNIWNIFTQIIPQSYRGDFKAFKAYQNKDSDTAAHVSQNIEDNTKWELTINLSGFTVENGKLDVVESVETLIHEFAHVLTLGRTQVRYTPLRSSEDFIERFTEDCQTHFIGEGCLNQNSYLFSFIQTFWKEDFIASQDEQEDDFYTGKENNFITEYAATNPGEDISESFTYFVLQSKPDSQTIADQKLLFFYEYPELIKLRDFIRSRIDR